MKKALVIIPTIGSNDLAQAVNSVLKQTYYETHCLVVVDGPQFHYKVNRVLGDNFILVDNEKLFRCDLPFNTGAGGWYGQRIMTAFSYLNDYDYVMFLDQDNWFDWDHVSSLVKTIEENEYEWAYSLRKITGKFGNFVCLDNCESLGKWPVWFNTDHHLIDNNCYCFTHDFLIKHAPLMNWGWGADRRFFTLVKDKSFYGCTELYSVNYRLGGNDGSVQLDFFLKGNAAMSEKYALTGFPWISKKIDLDLNL